MNHELCRLVSLDTGNMTTGEHWRQLYGVWRIQVPTVCGLVSSDAKGVGGVVMTHWALVTLQEKVMGPDAPIQFQETNEKFLMYVGSCAAK